MVPTESTLAAYPRELIATVASRAAEDADLVAYFLGALGLTASGATRTLPAALLLDLGAAMRLLRWEVGGLDLVRAGLPAPGDAALRTFDDAARRDPAAPARSLSREVFRFGVERLAWAGPATLGAEILLDVPDEDALVESLARFLWGRRRAATAERGDAS